MKVVEDFDVIAIETIQTVQSGNPYTRFLILANIAHRYLRQSIFHTQCSELVFL